MFNDAQYDSDTDDDDYVPTQGKGSGDDEVSSAAEDDHSEQEDEEVAEDGEQPKTKVPTKKKKDAKRKPKETKRSRKVNPLLAHINESVTNSVTGDLEHKLEETLKEDKDDKKTEDIWADFLADTEEKKEPVVKKPKTNSWASLLGKKKSKPSAAATLDGGATTATESPREVKPTPDKQPPKPPATVKITKVFDFAGEEVRVEEEVAADSAEALAAAAAATASAVPTVGGGVKRSKLSNLVGSLGSKKLRLSTLEKTALDWQNYKHAEGYEEELRQHNKSKDTYLEKQEFLQRADVRQFEIERDLRLGGRRSTGTR